MKKEHKLVSYAKWGYIFIAPFFIVYLVFSLIPLISTFVYSFFEYSDSGLSGATMEFAGLKNYTDLFTMGSSYNNGQISILSYAGNTMIMWIMGAVPQLLFSLILAVIFTSARLKIKGQRFFKTVIYMPNLIMAAAFAMLFWALFQFGGPIDAAFDWVGDASQGKFDFFKNIWSERTLVAVINFIMWFGNTTILLMAGIMGIDQSLFEAASIDGATSWQVFRKVTIPLLMPIMVYVVITSLIGGLQMFDVPQILTNRGGTLNGSKTLIMYLNDFVTNKQYGVAGAVSVLVFIITGILSMIVFKTMNTGDKPKKKAK
ncbi:MAG: sugar ABC transporter permease [Oscillospiraceae bacterium]|nr:sugar ABC transporter permease [Oscillospiraceae bacterium]